MGLLRLGLLLFLVPAWTFPAWQALPLRQGASDPGGEGCQMLEALAVDPAGDFLMAGTDVGGLYRSLDGGSTWEPSNVGYKPRGACAFAIDPKDPRRVLAQGANSKAFPWNGLWLSIDRGASWKEVLPFKAKGSRSFRESLAFGPDGRTAYWLAPCEGGGGLWRSEDGGLHWKKVQADLCDGIVKVDRGTLWLAFGGNGKSGLYRSLDQGGTLVEALPGKVLGLDLLPGRGDLVFISKEDGVWISRDSGRTFRHPRNKGLPRKKDQGLGLRNLKVSPADPDRMLLEFHAGKWGEGGRYLSRDGGASWKACRLDAKGAFLPANGRNAQFAWHPRDPLVAWSFGGDFLTRSNDGGKTFSWANAGNNGLACHSPFQFNAFDPDLLLVTSQDYNSMVTGDGGRSWKYLNVSGKKWGGFNYGGYALSPSVLFAGDAPSWGDPRTLKVSFNGGKSWKDTGLVGDRTDSACGDPGDPKTAFWHQWRTNDEGQRWEAMKGCAGVLTYDPSGKEGLFGVDGVTVTVSCDHGRTWTPLVETPLPVKDLAYDPQGRRLYVAADGLFVFDLDRKTLNDLSPRLEKDNHGQRKVLTVAVDPQDPSVVYAGYRGNIYLSDQAVRRSTDGGKTWTCLTQRPGDPGPDGGREVQCLRVHPKTRWLYVTTSCFGIWKHPPPTQPR